MGINQYCKINKKYQKYTDHTIVLIRSNHKEGEEKNTIQHN